MTKNVKRYFIVKISKLNTRSKKIIGSTNKFPPFAKDDATNKL